VAESFSTGLTRFTGLGENLDNPVNPVKTKPSGVPWIGDVPVGWKVMKLKYLIDVLPGYAFKSEGFDFSNGVRLLRGINVGVNSLKWDECVYWGSVINEELAAYQIQDGDLIIGLDRPWIADGTRVCFAKKEDLPCLLVQRVCRLRSIGGVILQIVNYWLSSEGFESALSCETTGVSVPHISPGQIMEFRIALPSLHEQRAIADYLDDKCAAIDKMVAEKDALIADLEAYKKSLIYETVTGKREVASNSMVK
jgi:type I restriction enzyme S subunit